MHVFSQAFANMLSLKYSGFASLCKYDFAGFLKLLHNLQIWFRSVLQYFTSFRLSYRKVLRIDFRKDSREQTSENHGKVFCKVLQWALC